MVVFKGGMVLSLLMDVYRYIVVMLSGASCGMSVR